MSVNLDARAIDQRIADRTQPRGMPIARTVPRHTLIFYGGWEKAEGGRLVMQPGKEITQHDRKENEQRPSFSAYLGLEQYFRPPSWSHARNRAVDA